MLRLRYYTADHGGMRVELREEEYLNVTMEEAIAHAEAKDTGWGFKYTVAEDDDWPGHGDCIIAEVADEVPDLITEIERLKKVYRAVVGEEYPR